MIQSNVIGIGTGIYTVAEISKILRLPYHKANRWLNKYWDGIISKELKLKYTNKIDRSKAVSFYTLIEFYVVYQLLNSEVSLSSIIKARIELSKYSNTTHPFAQKNIIKNIGTDGSKIFFHTNNNDILSLDGTKQLNITFIKDFYKNLDFDNELLASKYWPLGKTKSIIVDPTRQFGHPVVGRSNIFPETIYNLFIAGEEVAFIAEMYQLSEAQVNDAIEFCKAA